MMIKECDDEVLIWETEKGMERSYYSGSTL